MKLNINLQLDAHRTESGELEVSLDVQGSQDMSLEELDVFMTKYPDLVAKLAALFAA